MTSNIKRYSYDIHIQLGTLHIAIKFPCKVGTIWDTHGKITQASTKPDLMNGIAFVSQTLSSNFILEFDLNQNLFVSKPTTLKFLLYTQKGVREAGEINFDITSVLNKRLTQITMESPLQKCPDKKAKLSFTIRAVLRQEIKNNFHQPNFTAGFMPDIVKPAKSNIPSTISAPTSDMFKKNKVTQQNFNVPNTKVQAPNVPMSPTAPSVFKPQQSDNFNSEREALLLQNTNLSTLFLKAKGQNQKLRGELRRALEQKQDLYAQIQSYDNQMVNLRTQNQDLRRVEQMHRQAQQQLIKARTQLARIFNTATQLGGPGLTDRLQSAVGIGEREM